MNWRVRDKILETLFEGKEVYIKDTGVKITLDYFGSDLERNNYFVSSPSKKRAKEEIACKVNFVSKPTLKALKKCKSFHVRQNSHLRVVEIEGIIEVKELSLYPFETNSAKVLFKKQTKQPL